MLAVRLVQLRADPVSIQQNFAGFRRIQSRDDFGQRSLPASVSTHDEDNFSTAKYGIHRTKNKQAVFTVSPVGMSDSIQFQAVFIQGGKSNQWRSIFARRHSQG